MTNNKSKTVGLAASGGGFRASLFHLGVLKRLDELHILDKVNYISGVSGGAVIAGLYVFLKRGMGKDFRFEELESRLFKGVKENPRTRWLLLTLLLRFSLRLLPLSVWSPFERWLRRTFAFDNFFRDRFFGTTMLGHLDPAKRPEGCPEFPRLILNTTGLEIGQDFFLTPDYMGPQELAALGLRPAPSRTDPARFPLAQAVGASACVPAIFPPYTISVTPNPVDDETARTGVKLRQAHLVDGGVYDNQGFRLFLHEPLDPYISKPEGRRRKVDYVIASDASKTLSPSANPLPTNPLKRLVLRLQLLVRAYSITEDRARWERFSLLLYARHAKDLEQVAFFHTDSPWQEAPPYQLPDRMKHHLARLRTDFDSFSDLEIIGLMYLGYTLVNHRVFSYCRDLLPDPTKAALAEMPLGPTPWQLLVNRLAGPPPGVEPLKSWDVFAVEVSRRLPKRGPVIHLLLRWAERPWKPFLEEENPCQPRSEHAQEMAILHIEHGSTGSLVWRGLQRLSDRGGIWKAIARVGKASVVAVLVCIGVRLAVPIIVWLNRLIGAAGSWGAAAIRFVRHL
jgi:predicted acylesterase/phospholipase RssA